MVQTNLTIFHQLQWNKYVSGIISHKYKKNKEINMFLVHVLWFHIYPKTKSLFHVGVSVWDYLRFFFFFFLTWITNVLDSHFRKCIFVNLIHNQCKTTGRKNNWKAESIPLTHIYMTAHFLLIEGQTISFVLLEINASEKREITKIKCWKELSSLVNSVLSFKLIALIVIEKF